MKKLLLTLLLLLSLGFAASAQEEKTLELFDVTPNTSFSKTGTASTTETSLTIGSYDFKVCNVWWQKNAANSYMAFKKGGSPTPYLTMPAFEDKVITKIGIYITNAASAANSKFDVKVNGSKIGETITFSAQNTYAYFDVPTEYQKFGIVFSIVSANTGNQIGIGKLQISYTEDAAPEPTTKINLTSENFVVTAGEQILEDEETYNLDKDTSIKFTYNTDNTDAAIAYSYSLNLGETWEEGNTYTFTGEDDEYLTVKAASENEVTKLIYLNKWYPASCPAPKISLAVADTEVYAGKVITIDCNGADKTEWNVNGTPIEGTSYTITEAVGTELTFTVTNTTTVRVDGEVQEKTSTITRKVTVVEKSEVTFDFINKTYGLFLYNTTNSGSGNNVLYEENVDNPVTKLTEGLVTIDLEGKYRLWEGTSNNELRINANDGNFTVSVPSNYYIELITFDGTITKVTADKGSIVSSKWSYSDQISTVKFTVGGTRAGIKTITVKYAERPTEVVGLTHSVEAKSMTAQIAYTIHVNHHKEGKDNYEVIFTLNGEEISSTEHTLVGAAAPAMMREAAVEPTSTHKLTGTIHVTELDAKTEYNGTITVKHNDNPVDVEVAPVVFKTMNPTGIEDVTVDGNEEAEYFNLQGVRVAQPEAGQVYIVRRGAKVQKELVK